LCTSSTQQRRPSRALPELTRCSLEQGAPVSSRGPLNLAPLVGRRADIAGLGRRLAEERLVTLVGPGGVGKTRLAAELVATSGPRSFWAELAPVGPDLVELAVADALGVHEGHGEGALAAIVEALRGQAALLVLDNAEHVADAVAPFALEVLRCCPATRVLATSREPLGVPGEVVWQVAPLALPAADDPPEAAARCDAVQLFVARASAAAPSFTLDGGTVPAIVSICRRLDGLPLAIELAAANLRVVSVQQLATGLEVPLELLAGGPRTSPARHQGLRAALDWSYRLLDVAEEELLRRLSVFAGSFGLEAAAAVAGEGPATYGLLRRLVDKSLVAADTKGKEAAYWLLVTVRQYAQEKLRAAGEEDTYSRRHLQWWAARAAQAEARLGGPGQADELRQLDRDLNDIRAALEFAKQAGEATAVLEIASALGRFWYLHGHYKEGRDWLDWAVVAGGARAPEELKAKALRTSGQLAFLQCDYGGALRRLSAALRTYRRLEDGRGMAAVLQILGSVAREQGRYQQSERRHSEAMDLFEAAGDTWGVASSSSYLGFVAWLQGDFDRAAKLCHGALSCFEHQGDAEGTAWSLLSLGVVAQYRGDLAMAQELLERSRAISQEIGFREGIAWCQNQLGLVAVRQREPEGARELLVASIEAHRELGDQWRVASVLEALAATSALSGDQSGAASLLGAAAAARERMGAPVPPCERHDHERTAASVKEALGEGGFVRAFEDGKRASFEQLLELARRPPPAPAPAGAATAPSGALPGLRRQGPRLVVRALGPVEISVGGRLLEAADWGWAKPRELFLLLCCTAAKTKAQLGAMLWQELSEEQLRNALHTALRDLRRALGDRDWVIYSRGHYGFNSTLPHYCDVREFEAALSAARRAGPGAEALRHLQAALSVYRGDFLEDESASEWAEGRRRELSTRYGAALMATGAALVEEGRLRQAAQVYERAVAHDFFDEGAHRQLMKCLARLGERARALRQYGALAAKLEEQLGARPAAETTRLYAELLQGD
jgi:predicted ATPase/DNA-binding SARP family transcriptional activator